MKKSIFLSIIFTFSLTMLSLTTFSQTHDSLAFTQLQQKIEQLQTELKNQKSYFSKQLSTADSKIDSLQQQVQQNSNAINQTAQELSTKITASETSANQKITAVDHSLNKNSLWVMIGLLVTLIFSALIYFLLRTIQRADKTDMVEQLSRTKQSIDEKLVNEFAKNTEALESLSQLSKSTQIAEPDHSLALKVASEINLIERNINLMDSKTKGLKQLTRSVEKLKDNLAANGYEIPQLLDKEFNQGMKVIVASSIPDENLEKGVEKITKVLIPQVLFNGVMIQTAQIEVSVGY